MITKSRVRPRKVEEETTQMDFKLTQKEKEAALLLMQLSCDSDSRSGGTSSGVGGGGDGGDRRKGLEEINEVIEKEESVGDNSGEICSRKKEMNSVRKKKKFRYVVDLYNETKPLGLRKHGKK